MELPRRDPPELKDDWNTRTWIFPTLVAIALLGFALIYMFAVR
ncbi:MAG TPA: hypothetical protein VIU61_01460 [Kofleriaceae bacterium]